MGIFKLLIHSMKRVKKCLMKTTKKLLIAKRMMKAPDWLPYWVGILIQMKMMTIMIRMRNQKDLMVTTISKKTMMNKKMERAHLLNLVHLGYHLVLLPNDKKLLNLTLILTD